MTAKRRANKRSPTKHEAANHVTNLSEKSKYRITSGAPDAARVANICAAVGFLLYARSVWKCELPFDDGPAVRSNVDVLNENGDGVMSPWAEIFRHDFWGTPVDNQYTHKSYRPLVIASFRIDAMVSRSAWIFHLTNALLYAIACWLVVDVALAPLGEVTASAKTKRLSKLFAGLWFASHPIHTEAVASIVGRAEILASIFCLLGSKFYHSCNILSAAGCFAAACLCKETAVVMPLVFVGSDAVMAMVSPKIAPVNCPTSLVGFARMGSMTLVSLGYLVFRTWLFSGLAKGGSLSEDSISLEDNFLLHLRPLDKLRTALHIQAKYIQLLVWPRKVSCDYSLGVIEPVLSWHAPEFAFVAVTLCVTLMLALIAFQRIQKAGDASILLGLGWTFGPLIPASHIVGIGTTMAERLLFMPSIGVSMLVCQLVDLRAGASLGTNRAVHVALAFCIAWFGLKTMTRVPDWADSSTLMNSDILKHPRSLKLNLMLSKGWWGGDPIMSAKSYNHAKAAQEIADLHSESLLQAPYATGLPMMAFQKTRTTLWPGPDGANLTEALELANKVLHVVAQESSRGVSRDDMAFTFMVKGSALLKIGLPSQQDRSKLHEAVIAFKAAVDYDQSQRVPYLLFCNYGLTLAALRRLPEAYEQYQECFRRKEVTEIGFSDLSNYGNVLVELSGLMTGNVTAASAWGQKAIDAFTMILSHPEISEKDTEKWKRVLHTIRSLIEKAETTY